MKKSVKFSPTIQKRTVRMLLEPRGNTNRSGRRIDRGQDRCTAETRRR